MHEYALNMHICQGKNFGFKTMSKSPAAMKRSEIGVRLHALVRPKNFDIYFVMLNM